MGKHGQDDISPFARIAMGLGAMTLGLIPMLGSFDVGILRREQINGPPWMGFAAGSIFFVAGLMVLLGNRLEEFGMGFLIFLLMGAFAAVANWVAFGPGARACEDGSTGWSCRGPFGIGALMLDGVLAWMVCAGIARLVGPGGLATSVDRIGKALLVLGLAPILVPVLLVIFVKVGFDAVRERLRTGRWPRNEEFIARMKLKSC